MVWEHGYRRDDPAPARAGVDQALRQACAHLPPRRVGSILIAHIARESGEHLGPAVHDLIAPLTLYGLLTVGAVGVYLALPRQGPNLGGLGGLLAAGALGGLFLVLGQAVGLTRPNGFFYVFAFVGLGASLRVITHKKPVYAALHFILTILASAGLFVLLAAEFLAFALVLVYAGAILITYLFVIMLATQSASGAREGSVEDAPMDYDAQAREPLGATAAAFVLLAALTGMMFRGLGDLPRPPVSGGTDGLVPALQAGPTPIQQRIIEHMPRKRLAGDPAEQRVRNIEGVAFDLLADHPGAIEIAGVVLLMAMLGAVVLARRQVQLGEQEKARAAARLADGQFGPGWEPGAIGRIGPGGLP